MGHQATTSINMIGGNIVTLEQIGAGMFGSVYSCVDEYNNKFACKTCVPREQGIPNLVELSIMSSIVHPNLNSCLSIRVDSESVDIIQEMAITDLSKHIASTPYISIHLKRQWIYQILSAVKALHDCNIVHADIKANNVLLYSDNSVKLTDFTLSSIDHPSRNIRTVCNNMHRPVECLLKKSWSKPLDIWSLGCAIYHIVYGKSPFHHSRKEAAELRPACVLGNILQWFNCSPWTQGTLANLESELGPINVSTDEHCGYTLPPTFNLPENTEVNRLLGRMLQIIPSRRATVNELLADKWFSGINYTQHNVIPLTKITPLPRASKTKYYRILSRLCEEYPIDIRDDLMLLASNICERVSSILVLSDTIQCHTAVWISAKILGVRHPVKTLKIHELFEAERVICNHLGFNMVQWLR